MTENNFSLLIQSEIQAIFDEIKNMSDNPSEDILEGDERFDEVIATIPTALCELFTAMKVCSMLMEKATISIKHLKVSTTGREKLEKEVSLRKSQYELLYSLFWYLFEKNVEVRYYQMNCRNKAVIGGFRIVIRHDSDPNVCCP